jgi:hypothetical protein
VTTVITTTIEYGVRVRVRAYGIYTGPDEWVWTIVEADDLEDANHLLESFNLSSGHRHPAIVSRVVSQTPWQEVSATSQEEL